MTVSEANLVGITPTRLHWGHFRLSWFSLSWFSLVFEAFA